MQEVEKEFGIPVVPIIGMSDIIQWMETKPEMEEQLRKMKAYREEYGVMA